MFSARIFILLVSLIRLGYDSVLSYAADQQRKKLLPPEVADIYDETRYQTYLDFTADKKKLANKYKIISLIADTILIFSPLYAYIEKICGANPYKTVLLTFIVIWIIGTIIETFSSYEETFGLMEKYGLNKKDKKEFAKDIILNEGFGLLLTVGLCELLTYIGEHMAAWTHDFSVGYVKTLILCVILFAVIFAVMAVAQLMSYFVLKKQYVFTPLEEGELRDKINDLQKDSKKKVKSINVYNESKKTTTKNAFLLKLFWHREFGIADNFMNENAENELLGVLSHEIGHLKHKKNLLNYLGYAMMAAEALAVVYLLVNPSVCLNINQWIRDSFNLTVNNYYILAIVFGDILSPIMFGTGIFSAYRSRCEEYEADREAVKNGYGEDLIRTFKTLSSDELINVNPHPFIEFTEYDHPGMYQRIKAIRETSH